MVVTKTASPKTAVISARVKRWHTTDEVVIPSDKRFGKLHKRRFSTYLLEQSFLALKNVRIICETVFVAIHHPFFVHWKVIFLLTYTVFTPRSGFLYFH